MAWTTSDHGVAQPGPGAGAYARLFPNLPSFVPNLMPAWERRSADPAHLENPSIPVGYTYFGQFLAHDLSFDTSPMGNRSAPAERVNGRTPRLDLDSVYGAGPALQPWFYREAGVPGAFEFVVDPTPGDAAAGLPQFGGRALVADPRNDSHAYVRAFHVAMLRFHNRVLAELTSRGISGPRAFAAARQSTTWHYQWLVLNDYLPRLTGYDGATIPLGVTTAVERLLVDRQALPVEFVAGVFRFGHAMIRNSDPFGGTLRSLFVNDAQGRPAARADKVAWRDVLPIEANHRPRASMRILPLHAESLTQPVPNSGSDGVFERDFRRQLEVGLPSGQDLARALGLPPEQILPGEDDLYAYTILEAAHFRNGLALGPLASKLAIAVFVAAVRADGASYLRRDPHFQPLGAVGGAAATLASWVRYATADISDAAPSRRKRPGSGAARKTGEEDLERSEGARA